jgi:hypothetical protein
MLVKELIKELQECNPEAHIMIHDDAGPERYDISIVDNCFEGGMQVDLNIDTEQYNK